MRCNNCNGEMHGDGYTTVQVCENVTEEQCAVEYIDYAAPDEGPFYCIRATASKAIIADFYSSLIAEFSGTDDGHTPVLDEQLVRYMNTYKDNYMKRLTK
tara:strand:- start:352 stop:651 length:300 start_codon:yes stop_codon:yes gene_type:complete